MILSAQRLDLAPLAAEALDALVAGDHEALETVTGAIFPEPLVAPPLMDDALPFMRDSLRAEPRSARWGPHLMVLRETGEAVGSAGFSGSPDAEGVVTLGYSVYPAFQGRGFASEAAAALVAWALAHPGVRRVRATLPPWHVASQRVALHAGLQATGLVLSDPNEGPVEIWERAAGAT